MAPAQQLLLSLIVLLAVLLTQISAQNCTIGDYCPPINCSAPALLELPCAPGFNCPVDDLPRLCPSRYYCPDGVQILLCPRDSYCPSGSVKPVDCPGLSYCGSGWYRYFFWGAFLVYFVAVLLVLGSRYGIQRFVEGAFSVPVGGAGREQRAESIELRFDNLVVRKGSKTLIDGASGHFSRGKIAVIMGPSGAGKTTLLNCLAGKLDYKSGSLQINGRAEVIRNYRRLIGYVPQDDIMLRDLTVEEVITYSARTRLPAEWTDEQRATLVEEVIEVLDLRGVRGSVVGGQGSSKRGISGGERKRVNVGMELVANPALLFLDEPTSGLDAASAQSVMEYVARAAKSKGITVVAVLHQPRYEILMNCDDLLLLAQGGRTAYCGPISQAIPHFQTLGYPVPAQMNPADFFLDTLSGKTQGDAGSVAPQDIAQRWRDLHVNNQQGHVGDADASLWSAFKFKFFGDRKRSLPNFFKLLALGLERATLQVLRNFNIWLLDILVHAIVGLILGLAFVARPLMIPPIPAEYEALGLCPTAVNDAYCRFPIRDDIGVYGTYAAMAIGLVAATIGTRTFGSERAVYWRETAAGGNTVTYFLSKMIVEAPAIALNSLVLVSSTFLLLAPSGGFGPHYLTVFLLEWVCYGLGYWTSGLLEGQNAALLAAILALLQGLATGAAQDFKEMGPFSYLAWGRWFGEAFYITEVNLGRFVPEQADRIRKYLRDDRVKLDLGNRGLDWTVLLFYGIGLRMLAYVTFRVLYRSKQR